MENGDCRFESLLHEFAKHSEAVRKDLLQIDNKATQVQEHKRMLAALGQPTSDSLDVSPRSPTKLLGGGSGVGVGGSGAGESVSTLPGAAPPGGLASQPGRSVRPSGFLEAGDLVEQDAATTLQAHEDEFWQLVQRLSIPLRPALKSIEHLTRYSYD